MSRDSSSTPWPVDLPLDWGALQRLAPIEADRVEGPTNSQSTLRLFGQPETSVRVTLYRDHHAWCPYCQKVWLWLEERQVPYRIRKVTMFCYGEKESWYRQRVPSGMLPALEIDGQLVTESDHILEALEANFGPLGPGMNDPAVLPLRRLERLIFRSWCQWLCEPSRSIEQESRRRDGYRRAAKDMETALQQTQGPFFLDGFSTADLVFVPYLERMAASLLYYKAYALRQEHPAIDRWFQALEQRATYLGTQSDSHTHAHDLPPQMGGCYPSGTTEQQAIARRIDQGPWPVQLPDPETSAAAPDDAAAVALARVLRHRSVLLERHPANSGFDQALRAALTRLIQGSACVPPPGCAVRLRDLRDHISVPRDMPLHSARLLRQALEDTARLDPLSPDEQPPAIPQHHRRDQDPRPFLTTSR
ncbi:glutathione S-transferase family protein [Synechococcus sp. CS-1328]|uniref:glutathione S-transferase family protein n=1 Tax=Synechococcus sp. CS-1328 TaxID=2847976 RepID=UPI00223A797E|nr:glutathione S-transferase family protein [Synechococcus sp. CS-1328]MCT0226238.1 glutathione S-transferase family protein [Synechococcus sp. CS-1328]